LPCRRPGQEAARRNPARAVLDRHLYRPQRACSCGTRTPYAPGAGAEPYRHPVCRADDRGRRRRVGTLPGPCLTDTCTVHNGRARAAPVPPTRRGHQGECQEAARVTPNSQHRRHAASQSPGAPVRPSRDRRRRRRRPTRHAGHVLPGRTTDAGRPTAPALHANHAYPLTYPRAPGSAPPAPAATQPAPT